MYQADGSSVQPETTLPPTLPATLPHTLPATIPATLPATLPGNYTYDEQGNYIQISDLK